jgi:hypothetical protein
MGGTVCLRPQWKGVPTGGWVPLEGKALRLPPSNVRFAPYLPFSDMRPATKGAYPLGTPADWLEGQSAERGRRYTVTGPIKKNTLLNLQTKRYSLL